MSLPQTIAIHIYATGRLVTFLARVMKSHWSTTNASLGIGISEHSAILLDTSSGIGSFWGVGPIYFLLADHQAEVCDHDHDLIFSKVVVHKWNSTLKLSHASDSPHFDFKQWQATGLQQYALSAAKDELESSDGHIY